MNASASRVLPMPGSPRDERRPRRGATRRRPQAARRSAGARRRGRPAARALRRARAARAASIRAAAPRARGSRRRPTARLPRSAATARSTSSEIAVSPACARSVSRAARFTASPVTVYVRCAVAAGGRGDDFAARDADVRGQRTPELGGESRPCRRGCRAPRAARARCRCRGRPARRTRAITASPTCLSIVPPARSIACVGKLEIAREDPVDLLRVEAARHARVAGEIGKQNRDLPSLADGRRCALRRRQACRTTGRNARPAAARRGSARIVGRRSTWMCFPLARRIVPRGSAGSPGLATALCGAASARQRVPSHPRGGTADFAMLRGTLTGLPEVVP